MLKNSSTIISRKNQASTQQSLSLAFGVTLGCRPASEHEGNLVHEVCDVVDHVQEDLIHSSKQIAEQIAKWVDAPANCDNQSHGAEGACNSRAAARCGAACFTIEDLEEDEEPAQHATGESWPGQESADLTEVSESQHHHSATQELPEHRGAGWLASRLQDQVELNHLKGDSDAPVHIAIDNRRLVNLHPVLAHVHVVHTCNQSHQAANMQGGPPMTTNCCCLCQEEHSGRNHGDGDDPEGDSDAIMWLQESICWVSHRLRARHWSSHCCQGSQI